MQLQQLGQTLYATSSFAVPAAGAQTLMCWLNANGGTWEGTPGVRSMCGVYSSSNVAGGAGVASQIGTRGTNVTTGQLDVWDWGGTVMVSTTGYTPPLNTWIHVTFTYDGTTASIYINGVLNNSAAFTKTVGTLNMVFINGYIYGATAETSQFIVDEVMFYNRVLTANEILSVYTAQGRRDGAVLGLVARFSFNSGYPGKFTSRVGDESISLQSLFPQHNTAVTQPGGTGWTLGSTTTATLATIVAPDASTTGSQLVFSSASQTTSSAFLSVLTTTANTSYTSIAYIKNNGTSGSIQVLLTDAANTNEYGIILNLSGTSITAGTTSTTGGVNTTSFLLQSLQNGWYSLYLTATFTSAVTIGVSFNGETGSASANFYAWNADVFPTANLCTFAASYAAPSNIRVVSS